MNDRFDELAKGMAQSVTRRGALKKFGAGLAGVVLATLGLANNAQASRTICYSDADCPWNKYCTFSLGTYGYCARRRKGGP